MTTIEQEAWEKEFDKLWRQESGLTNDGDIDFTKPFKSFISALLSTHSHKLLASVMEEVQKLKEKYRNTNGWEDGINALDDVLESLSAKNK